MPDDRNRGLYAKYQIDSHPTTGELERVYKVVDPHKKPVQCLILDFTDRHARRAIRTFIRAVEEDGYAELGKDLRRQMLKHLDADEPAQEPVPYMPTGDELTDLRNWRAWARDALRRDRSKMRELNDKIESLRERLCLKGMLLNTLRHSYKGLQNAHQRSRHENSNLRREANTARSRYETLRNQHADLARFVALHAEAGNIPRDLQVTESVWQRVTGVAAVQTDPKTGNLVLHARTIHATDPPFKSVGFYNPNNPTQPFTPENDQAPKA